MQLLSFFRSFAINPALWDTSRDGCYCHSHHLHVSPCPTPRTSALNNCPCPDVVSLCHNPLNPWTLTRFNRRHEASSSGRLPLNSLPLNSRLIGFSPPYSLLIGAVVICPPTVVTSSDQMWCLHSWWSSTTCLPPSSSLKGISGRQKWSKCAFAANFDTWGCPHELPVILYSSIRDKGANFHFLLSAICVLHTLLRLLSKLFPWAFDMKLQARLAQTDRLRVCLPGWLCYTQAPTLMRQRNPIELF